MATAPGSAMRSWLASASARPMVAAEDVTSALKKAAASTAMIGVAVIAASMSSASWLSRRGATPSRMIFRPRNMSPRPSTACPKSRALARRATKVMTNPRPTTSSAQSVILKAISCTVSVVPMSAPRMMPSVWRNVMIPADTNPISISVVAAEDWMMAVTAAPEATATTRLRDSPVRSWRSRPPTARCRLSPLSRMP